MISSFPKKSGIGIHSPARILLIGDMDGPDDEGMKRITRKLATVLNIGTGLNASAVSPRQALQLVDSTDIVHYIGGPTYRSVLFLALCRFRNVRVVTILTFTNPALGVFGLVALRLLPPNHIIVSSSNWKHRIAKLKLGSDMICVSGVDEDKFRPIGKAQKENLRKKLALPLNRTLVLHVGHLKADRNLEMLANMHGQRDLQALIVASTTTKQSTKVASFLENNGVILIRTYQPTIEEYYQCADCYVFPTIDEAACVQVPLSILEAMSVNLPIVTTQFGGLSDFIPPTDGVFYITPSQFYDLPKIVRSAVKSKIRTRHLVRDLTWESVGNRLREIYFRSLLE